ncbi:glycerophosphodiester phosphodiesterase family protein [Kineothrix sp. MB12-C1]|uniref:glycerophosphodiester phosphodiesterase family protein n=1 Tax=Kineothrix sp. MB12-C1 TaxID=3070215 RepID=UPI0027D2CF48|nr:glycerophosphodiester phosphodiesterase family protein [Kineothrix sp. MB12-C1]WMC93874.1 glycerophosphodiester phosphodiesterase family protein [Kineothrix sp. MB12-C1]
MKYQTKIYGHRGASEYAAENTMKAFHMAYDMGADGVEFDIQVTRDGYLVVTHDEWINRVSDGTGCVKDYDLEELRKFKFNKLHPEQEDSAIPLLEEVLEQLRERCNQDKREFLFNIELKNNVFPYDGMEEKVLQIVKEKNVLENTLFSSFSHASMLKIRELESAARVAFLYCDGIMNVEDYAQRYNVNTVHPAWYLMDRNASFEALRQREIEINIWTVNGGKEIRRFCDMGVNGIITNKPDLGSEIRDDK